MKYETGYEVDGFEFHIDARQDEEGKHWGRIFFTANGETQQRYVPPFLLSTLTAFKTVRGARIEAESLAYELIKTRTINAFLP